MPVNAREGLRLTPRACAASLSNGMGSRHDGPIESRVPFCARSLMPVRMTLQVLRAAWVAGSCCLLVACGGGEAPGTATGPAPATPVNTTVVATEAWNDTISALGTVKARESVAITAKVSETVERVHFDSGAEVSAGATLVTLSGNQQQASLRAAEAEAQEAEQQFRRGNELVQSQLIARSQVDTQRATRDAAQARVAQMRADIGDRRVRAPFAGVLGIRQVSPGALVTPGTLIATLDDISRVYVDFQVPEQRLGQLAIGQVLSATSAAWQGADFRGTVASIETRVDPDTRAVTVRGDFANEERRLRPGMLMQVVLQRPERQALVVPEIALVQVGRERFVWRVAEDDKVERVAVEAGERVAGRVEIVDGLSPGDRIVVDGTGKLRPGMQVSDAGSGPGTEGAPAAEGG